ncbi:MULTISPECIES: hypothetical protein [Rhodococcus]|uniref:Uncharacterized protein n=1 Tax=Rhodococcus oxybenzonivorans TaxID=1990687 RepID=A0AAE5A6L8_9NOCA|nr:MULTISPECIES: hypothetical protein [Rhodococcus]MDV7240573.1 hypothetical protein [Rhodococcus oxybenzonivorans]MDV7265732.1 hypothetical protein [Rhodococcus oxybenzonivorans]MDV7272846.1 hypothetical protein [Rhodococcus oxybenzonivorans]MDV7333415.1 hypothetical protein [Rhodococcus oxybenzonivorans]MDV7342582.1 hypothetical protein [Rhodococcus oxybenzonivorans]
MQFREQQRFTATGELPPVHLAEKALPELHPHELAVISREHRQKIWSKTRSNAEPGYRPLARTAPRERQYSGLRYFFDISIRKLIHTLHEHTDGA